MSDKKYRVWIMHNVLEPPTEYRYEELLTYVIGTPYGIQDILMTAYELELLKIALLKQDKHTRPNVYYQEVDNDPIAILKELLEKGKLEQEKEKKRVEKNLEIAKKKEETARKNKENKERREFEKLKKKFGD